MYASHALDPSPSQSHLPPQTLKRLPAPTIVPHKTTAQSKATKELLLCLNPFLIKFKRISLIEYPNISKIRFPSLSPKIFISNWKDFGINPTNWSCGLLCRRNRSRKGVGGRWKGWLFLVPGDVVFCLGSPVHSVLGSPLTPNQQTPWPPASEAFSASVFEVIQTIRVQRGCLAFVVVPAQLLAINRGIGKFKCRRSCSSLRSQPTTLSPNINGSQASLDDHLGFSKPHKASVTHLIRLSLLKNKLCSNLSIPSVMNRSAFSLPVPVSGLGCLVSVPRPSTTFMSVSVAYQQDTHNYHNTICIWNYNSHYISRDGLFYSLILPVLSFRDTDGLQAKATTEVEQIISNHIFKNILLVYLRSTDHMINFAIKAYCYDYQSLLVNYQLTMYYGLSNILYILIIQSVLLHFCSECFKNLFKMNIVHYVGYKFQLCGNGYSVPFIAAGLLRRVDGRAAILWLLGANSESYCIQVLSSLLIGLIVSHYIYLQVLWPFLSCMHHKPINLQFDSLYGIFVYALSKRQSFACKAWPSAPLYVVLLRFGSSGPVLLSISRPHFMFISLLS